MANTMKSRTTDISRRFLRRNFLYYVDDKFIRYASEFLESLSQVELNKATERIFELAQYGSEKIRLQILEYPNLLKLQDGIGNIVAHELARYGTEKVQLKLLEFDYILGFQNKGGVPVVSTLSGFGTKRVQDEIIKRRVFEKVTEELRTSKACPRIS